MQEAVEQELTFPWIIRGATAHQSSLAASHLVDQKRFRLFCHHIQTFSITIPRTTYYLPFWHLHIWHRRRRSAFL